jgi:PAS domain S-box-containing protein
VSNTAQGITAPIEFFQLVTDTAPVMIWMSGVDKLCTYCNQQWLDFRGRPLEAELGDGWSEGVHPEDFRNCVDNYVTAFERRECFHLEYRLLRHDGEFRWVLDSGTPRFDADGSFMGYIGSVIDVTDHKFAEAALSTISQRLIQAQEYERARIARELHDDIGQRLSLLMMSLRGLSGRTSVTEIQDGIQKAIKQVLDITGEMRVLSHRLHSPSLEYVGLDAAANAYCIEVADQHNADIGFSSEKIPRGLSPDVSLCLYRILQEAVQNAIKHSGSRKFQVLLKGGTDEIELVVRDTGRGFDPQHAFKGSGIGLSTIKERLKLVNGRVSIESKLGRGTTIHAHVPIEPTATKLTEFAL